VPAAIVAWARLVAMRDAAGNVALVIGYGRRHKGLERYKPLIEINEYNGLLTDSMSCWGLLGVAGGFWL
jgi:hypothetical protein